uniref:Uncharacterized protein n=1 Tax=Steinernema glaseri TaxID=37863 RepID=A0A1I8ABL3_9BILA
MLVRGCSGDKVGLSTAIRGITPDGDWLRPDPSLLLTRPRKQTTRAGSPSGESDRRSPRKDEFFCKEVLLSIPLSPELLKKSNIFNAGTIRKSSKQYTSSKRYDFAVFRERSASAITLILKNEPSNTSFDCGNARFAQRFGPHTLSAPIKDPSPSSVFALSTESERSPIAF